MMTSNSILLKNFNTIISANEQGLIKDNKSYLYLEDEIIKSYDYRPSQIEIDCKGKMITPGFVDPHTHPVFLNTRHDEFIMRLKGMSYEQIAINGGGIISTIDSVNKSSEENIIAYVDCGLDIPSNWLESSLNQMNKNNSDMVSVRIFTDGENIIDKSFIAQTYGFKNNQICLPGSLIKRNVFNLIGLFLNKARASYDTDFIKKFHNHNLKQSINDKVILKYLGINYTNSLSNGARKVYSYSLDAWNAAGDKKPIIYIFLFIISLITFFLSSQIFLILMISYLILRSILIPIYKSKKSLSLIISYNIFYLLIAGMIIDISRIGAYIKSFITKYNNYDKKTQ